MCQPNCFTLWIIHLLHPIVFILFGIWIINWNNEYNNYESQCDGPNNIANIDDSNCPNVFGSDKDCECIVINEGECEIAYNMTNCIGYGYSCTCSATINYPIVLKVIGYTILTDILLFEFIKILIVWRVCCILSNIKNQPNIRHDTTCLRCSIAALGNSYLLRCIMCNRTGKSIVLYMYHRTMLFKGCGCCCIFFLQTMIGGGLIFFYGYVMMIGLITNVTFASPTLWYITLIINCVWIGLQFIYCLSPKNTNDADIQLEVGKYNLPFVTDIRPSQQAQTPEMMQQQLPLQVIQQPVQAMQPQVVYLQQQLANGQVVYMQQQPQPQPQPQQTVVVVPQPVAMTQIQSASIGDDYQIINANASAPPPAVNPEFEAQPQPQPQAINAYNHASAPPPAYNDFVDDNAGNGGEGGEGGVTNM